MGRSPRLPCSGSGIGCETGRSQLLGKEPGKEGIMVALGHGDGGIGGTFLSVQSGGACFLLLEGPCSSLDARAGCSECWRKAVSLSRRGASARSCSAVARSIAWRSAVVVASAGADTRARARRSSTSRGETFASSACCAWSKLAETDARCPRWGGGPSLAAREARGSGAVGRKPGVRPVLGPVVARRSVGPMGEKSRSGPEAEGGGESVLVVASVAVPVFFVGDAVGNEVVDMPLREARKAARGVKSRGGATRTVKGGWSATRVVTRGAGEELL